MTQAPRPKQLGMTSAPWQGVLWMVRKGDNSHEIIHTVHFFAGCCERRVRATAIDGPGQGAKPAPHAKTQEEFKAFSTASATTGGAAMEAAADSFAKTYPD